MERELDKIYRNNILHFYFIPRKELELIILSERKCVDNPLKQFATLSHVADKHFYWSIDSDNLYNLIYLTRRRNKAIDSLLKQNP